MKVILTSRSGRDSDSFSFTVVGVVDSFAGSGSHLSKHCLYLEHKADPKGPFDSPLKSNSWKYAATMNVSFADSSISTSYYSMTLQLRGSHADRVAEGYWWQVLHTAAHFN